MSVRLEPVAPCHLPFLAALLEREAQWFSFNPPLDWCAAGPDQWCWMVVTDDEVVGFAQCSRWQDGTAPPVLVSRYAVREDRRRLGYGGAILRELDAHAEALGLPLVACVMATNEPSLALCRQYFGEPLYTGEDQGMEIVVFGSRAEALR